MKHVILLFLFACPVWGQRVTITPAEPKAGDLIVIVAAKDASFFGYKKHFDGKHSHLDGRKLFLTANPSKTTTYSFSAIFWEEKAVEEIEITVTVGEEPKPVPIPPVDPFLAALKGALATETSANKLAEVKALAELYRHGQSVSKTAETWGFLFGSMAATAKMNGVTGTVPAVQKVIAAVLVAALPSDAEAVMDEAGRKLALDTFGKVAKALEALP